MERINGDKPDVKISRHKENMLVMNKAEAWTQQSLGRMNLKPMYKINLRMQRLEMREQ